MLEDRYDVIIIGTGAGGGTLAHELAPTGKSITLVFSVHIWFRDGLACAERVFYDRLGLLRQLGGSDGDSGNRIALDGAMLRPQSRQ